jgi:ankyrin repeat protein
MAGPLAIAEGQLTLAAAAGDARRCRDLLPRLAEALRPAPGSATGDPIVEAARWGYTEVLQLLLEAYSATGALADGLHARALYHACEAGHAPAVRLLIASGDGGTVSEDGGADIEYGGAAYGYSFAGTGQGRAVRGSTGAVLGDGGPARLARGAAGSAAILRPPTPSLTLCPLACGLPGVPPTSAHRLPLHAAAQWGHVACVDALLTARVNVDTTDSLGRSALHSAAAWGCIRTARALLQCNASPTVQDAAGTTPQQLAQKCNHDRLALLLGAPGACPAQCPLTGACSGGSAYGGKGAALQGEDMENTGGEAPAGSPPVSETPAGPPSVSESPARCPFVSEATEGDLHALEVAGPSVVSGTAAPPDV